MDRNWKRKIRKISHPKRDQNYQILTLFLVVIFFFCFSFNGLAQKEGIIIGKEANLRPKPTIIDSPALANLKRGTIVSLLKKSKEKIIFGNIEGYWYEVQPKGEEITGWIFEKYIATEGSPQIENFIKEVINGLYYYRVTLQEDLKKIKDFSADSTIFSKLEGFRPNSLNYYAYHLLAERNKLAIPLLIEFMNPQHNNSPDANYYYHWTILQKLTPQILIPNNYPQFKSWWEKNWQNYDFKISSLILVEIFQTIKSNEDRVYRSLPPSP